MSDFLKFFEEKVENYPMHMEIYYSKTMDWCIHIWKLLDVRIEIAEVQGSDMELVFAKAHVELKEWLLENEGGY
ncbi:hypothetical protein [Acetobacterium malicum]|uniref:hypothetical protein n=1 Tax=Acetobacterium malicum TaxID=52692 RepID=UPI00040BC6E3|nr:hypothetical protein [Acetobacterium dehalogenans]